MRRSRVRTTWLAADCESWFAVAAWEKLRKRATSQNTLRASNCMGATIAEEILISSDGLMSFSNTDKVAGSEALLPVASQSAQNPAVILLTRVIHLQRAIHRAGLLQRIS